MHTHFVENPQRIDVFYNQLKIIDIPTASLSLAYQKTEAKRNQNERIGTESRGLKFFENLV